MPNFYERVTAIPDSLPAQLSGPLPAGAVAGYADAGVWRRRSWPR